MNIIIIQSKEDSAQTIANLFKQRGDSTNICFDPTKALSILKNNQFDLAVVDLHLSDDILFPLLKILQKKYLNTQVIITNKYPDLSRELDVKSYGPQVFLRAPFTKTWFEKSLRRLDQLLAEGWGKQVALPNVRVPIRFKIILPFLVLALLLATGAGYIVSKLTLDSIEDRFLNNLVEVGHLTTSWIVEEETRLLETLRSLAYTDGVANSIQERNAEMLRELILGEAINRGEEAIEILDTKATTLVSVRHRPSGGREEYDYSKADNSFASSDFVQQVLHQQVDEHGDKYGGLTQGPWGDYFYVAGPIFDEQDQLVGVILVGRSVTTLAKETRDALMGEEDQFAHITFYDSLGQPLATTYIEQGELDVSNSMATEILSRQVNESHMRPLHISNIDYREIISAWEVRGGQDLGLIGASLAENFLVRPSQITQFQIFGLATAGFLLIIIIGYQLAQRINNPLSRVVTAVSRVSKGNLNTKVEATGNDELTFLAHAFNYMVSNLREGKIYRDLLGRTVTPQVRDQLRRGLASGDFKLEGQNLIATIIITDIRDFTVVSENQTPTKILQWLNQYYSKLVPIVANCDGVANTFVGDSLMASFGILPVPQHYAKSAYQACLAAIEMIQVIDDMNTQRGQKGEPPLISGIGINTGMVASGGMGTEDRLHYAIIGDTVNTASRLEKLTKEFGTTSAIISQDTYTALGDQRENFNFQSMGTRAVKGKSESIHVYRLLPQDQIT